MKPFTRYLLFLVLIISVKSFGAETKSFAYYDSLTYDQYTRQEWKTLTVTGREALKDGYDYYYLRMRMGIAYYQLKNFLKSIPHFRKAIYFNSADPTAIKYLYFALVESGQEEDAALLAFRNQTVITEEGNKRKILEFVYTEGGYTPDAISGRSASELIGTDSISGEEDTYAGQTYFHVGASLQLLPALSGYLGYSVLGIEKEKHFAGGIIGNQLDSVGIRDYGKAYFYSFPYKIADTLIPYKADQHEFYISANWIPHTNLTIIPAFHYISGTTQSYTPALQLIQRTDTAFYQSYDSTWHFFDNTVSRYVISREAINYTHYVVSLAASVKWRNFIFGLNGTYAQLSSKGKQLQAGISATWYPFGNLNLYASTSFTGFANGRDKRLVYDQAIGVRIAPKLWIEGLLTIGELALYNEKNAFTVYNLSDRIQLRTGANLIITLSPHLDLSFMYRFYAKEYDYLYYRKPPVEGPPLPIIGTTRYFTNNFLGGLKWKL